VASVLILFTFVSALYVPRSEPRDAHQGGLQRGVPVTLTLNMPEARSVSVRGTFNAWDENGYEMKRDEAKGAWTLVLHLPAGHYEYAFVLDGQTIVPDPQAEFYQDDGFGNQNGVLIVGNHHDRAI
jgi:1,4-alpha-glucan branching enzyme